MKRIILDCDLMKYPDSGLYHYCLNLGKYVQREMLKENRESLRFYVPSAARNAFDAGNKCIIEKSWHNKYFKPFLWNCDVWHAPFQSGRILKNKPARTKILLTIHDLNVLHEDKPDKERKESLERTQQLIDASDSIVCISHHCKKDVLAHMDTGNKPIHVIYNGTHHVEAPPVAPAGFHPSKPFVFALGYINKKKNFHALLPLLENEELELVLAGKLDEPDYIATMKMAAERSGVADRLHILGPVSEQDKAWYYQNALAFALPSIAEGFGAPVVEAMQFGKPIFLSHATSLPEIGGEVAFYFKNYEPDHMKAVFASGIKEYQRNGLAQKIMERGAHFNWEEKAKEYLKVYRSLY